jgi:hypothetical protein
MTTMAVPAAASPAMTNAPGATCVTRAHRLNVGCTCESLDRTRLAQELEAVSPGFFEAVMKDRPHLFSNSVVYVGDADRRRMAELIAAIERVVHLPEYQDHVLAWAPAIARDAVNAKVLQATTGGVFLGYDFHVADPQTGMAPQLIEINTNAGGGLLNAVLARAQYASCDDLSAFMPGDLGTDTPEHLFVDMFRQERRLTSTDSLGGTLSTVAIVDSAPEAQFLYPEFVLFRKLFEQAGLRAVICDPAELSLRDGALWQGETRIDLVYNRLTDFAFEDTANAVLREAYLSGAALVTPNPRGHALYADKRNLVTLTDDALLAHWGVDAATRAVLTAGIPRTERVERERADDFWARRKQLFFKPAAGYGSKATYRGDKLTTRVFDEILNGNYIAQALVPPSLRRLEVDGKPTDFKLDLRNYVYDAQVQLVVARLWQGQTTNFRTPGGGFAPVLAVPRLEDATT